MKKPKQSREVSTEMLDFHIEKRCRQGLQRESQLSQERILARFAKPA